MKIWKLGKSWGSRWNEDQTFKTLILPVVTYGSENWTIRKNEETRLNSFKMKGVRHVLRVSRTSEKSKEWLLETTGVKGVHLNAVKSKNLSYYGHGPAWIVSGKRPWLKDILASLVIRGAKTPLHRFNTDVGTKSMGDDLTGMVFSCFITSSTVTGINSGSCGPLCAPSKKNGL